MATRRSFIAALTSAAAAVATTATAVGSSATAATPSPAPRLASPPPPTASPPPSRLAMDLAQSLQRALPQAKLSDAMTAQIARDVEDNFFIAKTFRKTRLRNSQEPDFAFFADPDGECK